MWLFVQFSVLLITSFTTDSPLTSVQFSIGCCAEQYSENLTIFFFIVNWTNRMTTTIPIVDLAKINCSDNVSSSDWDDVAMKIRRNLHEVGFMYLINHGVPQDIVRRNENCLAVTGNWFLIFGGKTWPTSRLGRTLKSVRRFSHFPEQLRWSTRKS